METKGLIQGPCWKMVETVADVKSLNFRPPKEGRLHLLGWAFWARKKSVFPVSKTLPSA